MCDTAEDSSPQSDESHEALGVTGNQCTLMSIQQQRLIVPSSSSLEALGETSVSVYFCPNKYSAVSPFELFAGGDLEVWKGHHFKGLTQTPLACEHVAKIPRLCSGVIPAALGTEAITSHAEASPATVMSSPRPRRRTFLHVAASALNSRRWEWKHHQKPGIGWLTGKDEKRHQSVHKQQVRTSAAVRNKGGAQWRGRLFNFSLMWEETWDKTAGTCMFQTSLNLPWWFGCTHWHRSPRLALVHLITKANIPVRNKDQCWHGTLANSAEPANKHRSSTRWRNRDNDGRSESGSSLPEEMRDGNIFRVCS